MKQHQEEAARRALIRKRKLAAIKIQLAWFRFAARRKLHRRRLKYAAVNIQRTWRGWAERCRLEDEWLRWEAAHSLQRVWRGNQGRARARLFRSTASQHEDAAVILQKVARAWLAGRIARRRLDALRLRAEVEVVGRAELGVVSHEFTDWEVMRQLRGKCHPKYPQRCVTSTIITFSSASHLFPKFDVVLETGQCSSTFATHVTQPAVWSNKCTRQTPMLTGSTKCWRRLVHSLSQ
jgi:hypothetical protein